MIDCVYLLAAYGKDQMGSRYRRSWSSDRVSLRRAQSQI